MPNLNPSPETRFKSAYKEPLTSHVALKMSASLSERLKKRENWQQFVRETLDKALAELEAEEQNIKSA
ncbi:MAG: hypothetical protein QNJ54_33240 [Prochloraceae cyanobacterium]|nr:hypothetical protein [Prochloraceae cyanobacterium]